MQGERQAASGVPSPRRGLSDKQVAIHTPGVGPPDPPTQVTDFEVFPAWKESRSLSQREAVQLQIKSLLVPLVQNDLIEFRLSKNSGISMQSGSGASFTFLHTNFHGRAIDPKHEDHYRLAVVPLTPVAQKVGAKSVPVLPNGRSERSKRRRRGKGRGGR
jgi:hypothetical protein